MNLEQILSQTTVKREPMDEEQVEKPDNILHSLMAVGGCRKCARTFNNRLELIHHFVDHFPAIFYSFEAPQQSNEQIVDPTFLAQLSEILAAKPKAHKAVPSVKPKPKESSSLLPYHMCSTCCLTFSELGTYEEHLQLHSTKEPSVSCDQCGIKCSNSYTLAEHRKQHAKVCFICAEMGEHLSHPFSCKDCGKCYSSRKELAEHNKSHRIVNAEDESPTSKELRMVLPPRANEQRKSLLDANPYFTSLIRDSSRRRRGKHTKKIK